MLWVREADEGQRNVWWSEPQGHYTANFGDATVYAGDKGELPAIPHATWVALDMDDWLSE